MEPVEFYTTFTVFPQDTNYNTPPSVFGGKVLAEMDNCAAMTARRALYETEATDAITVNVTNVNFYIGALVGEIVHLKGTILKVGNKSIDIQIVGHRENRKGEVNKMCDGVFRFVSRKDGIPFAHGLKNNDCL